VSLYTSESTASGHPDKIADQIADAVVDEVLKQDEFGRAGIEVLVNSTVVVVSGEFHTNAALNIHDTVLRTVERIGYTDRNLGFSTDNLSVLISARRQSEEISAIIEKGEHQIRGLFLATPRTKHWSLCPHQLCTQPSWLENSTSCGNQERFLICVRTGRPR